jgi:hypothetical protein
MPLTTAKAVSASALATSIAIERGIPMIRGQKLIEFRDTH